MSFKEWKFSSTVIEPMELVAREPMRKHQQNTPKKGIARLEVVVQPESQRTTTSELSLPSELRALNVAYCKSKTII